MTRLECQVAVVGGGIVGTYLARLLVRRGLEVALVEKGPDGLDGQMPAAPAVRCTRRDHAGVRNARNHVLGGNGYNWGGGLVVPHSARLDDVLGLSGCPEVAIGEDLKDHFGKVASELGLRRLPGNVPFPVEDAAVGSCRTSEIHVLPGRSRNVAAAALAELRKAGNCTILPQSDILGFDRSSAGHVCGLRVRHRRNDLEIACSALVLCAGTVDTNLLLMRHGDDLGLAHRERIGMGLHDHISVPLAAVGRGRHKDFMRLIAPTFRDGGVVGTRFDLEAGGRGEARGVLHFQFLFDEVAPYREIKQVLALRQRGAGLAALAAAAARMTLQLPQLAAIGSERFLRGRLHIGSAVPIVATLDFESAGGQESRLDFDGKGDAGLSWNLAPDDEVSFGRLVLRARALIAELQQRFALDVELLGEFDTAEGRLRHLRDRSTDAYHLGGGVPIGTVADHDLRLREAPNAFVVSSAVFRRPGLANPTMTLLALAHRCADAISADMTRH